MRVFILFLTCLMAPEAFSQHLFSFGIKGGVPLTDPVSSTTFNGIDTTMHVYSNSKNYLIGPMVELNLPLGLAVEADALFRPLNLSTDTQVIPTSTVTHASINVSSMEFPILLKAHLFRAPVVQPYVEAGPAFRYVASPFPYFSNKGFALGGGVDLRIPLVKISPELRYSRWGADSANPQLNVSLPPSSRNQVELLIGISF